MRQDYTHITLILDRSGSMSSVKDAAEEAFNGYVASQRNLPGKCTVTVRQFDTEHDVVCNATPIADCPKMGLRVPGCESGRYRDRRDSRNGTAANVPHGWRC